MWLYSRHLGLWPCWWYPEPGSLSNTSSPVARRLPTPRCTMLTFTIVASIVTGMPFGLVPAAQVYGSESTDPLKKAGRALSAGKHRVRDSLVVAEVALALVLLAG